MDTLRFIYGKLGLSDKQKHVKQTIAYVTQIALAIDPRDVSSVKESKTIVNSYFF